MTKKTYAHVKNGLVIATVYSPADVPKMEGVTQIEIEGREPVINKVFDPLDGAFYDPVVEEIVDQNENVTKKPVFDAKGRALPDKTKPYNTEKALKYKLDKIDSDFIKNEVKTVSAEKKAEIESRFIDIFAKG